MPDLMAVYDDARQRLSATVRDLSPAELSTTVPATPDWTVHDVLAHLAGNVAGTLDRDIPADFFLAIGNAEAIGRLDHWTDRMVAVRREVPVGDLLDRWEQDTARLSAELSAGTSDLPGVVESALVTDIAAHSQDVHGALGRPRDRAAAEVRIGIASYLAGLRLWQPDLPALRVVTPDKTYEAGTGDSPATVHVDRWELFRALAGRRSQAQIRSYDWDADPDPYLAAFAPYGVRTDDLVEPAS